MLSPSPSVERASFALAPPASAAVDGTLTSLSAPTVLDAANQSAGNLNVKLTAAAVANDTIDIRVARRRAIAPPLRKPLPGWPSHRRSTTTRTSRSAWSTTAAAAANHNNVLRLTFTGAVPADTDIVISSIKYNIGATVPTFPDPKVRVKLGGDPYVAGNATIGKVDRLAGDTRYSTAGAIAEAQNDCAEDVVIVSGVNFPAWLAASYLGKPILLVETNRCPRPPRTPLLGSAPRTSPSSVAPKPSAPACPHIIRTASPWVTAEPIPARARSTWSPASPAPPATTPPVPW